MRALRAVSVVLVLAASSCVPGPAPGGLTALLAGGLRPFSDCEEVLGYLKGRALERVTPWGLPGPWGGPELLVEEAVEDEAGVRAPVPGADFSTTNVQVAGVDEPDLVKTDGERLLALARGRLFVVDLSGDEPKVQGFLGLRGFWARDMLFLGDRALLLGEAGECDVPREFLRSADDVGFAPTGRATAFVEVDLADPERPRIAGRLLVDGRYLSARMIDGVARVVVRSFPGGLRFEYPEGDGLGVEREALRRNRDIIRGSTIEDWIPSFVFEEQAGAVLAEGTLLDCASAFHPP